MNTLVAIAEEELRKALAARTSEPRSASALVSMAASAIAMVRETQLIAGKLDMLTGNVDLAQQSLCHLEEIRDKLNDVIEAINYIT